MMGEEILSDHEYIEPDQEDSDLPIPMNFYAGHDPYSSWNHRLFMSVLTVAVIVSAVGAIWFLSQIVSSGPTWQRVCGAFIFLVILAYFAHFMQTEPSRAYFRGSRDAFSYIIMWFEHKEQQIKQRAAEKELHDENCKRAKKTFFEGELVSPRR